jgi:excisionase family DNA binding protein
MHEVAIKFNPMDGGAGSSDALAYTVPHAAELLDLSPRLVWHLVHTGAIESVKIGRSRRITREALIAYLNSLLGAA